MFGIGQTEWIIILVIVILVFGVSKLPQVGRSLGQVIREFRDSVGDGKIPEADDTPLLTEQVISPSLETSLPSIREALDQAAGMEKKQRVAIVLNTLLATFEANPYQLAKQCGVDRATIGRWLKGETEPQQEKLENVLDVMPGLSALMRQEVLVFLGYITSKLKPQVTQPPQIYLSCHGEDLIVEREKTAETLGHPMLAFNVAVGDATFPPAEIEANVRHSDYLVMIQGWRWLSVRIIEHRAAVEESDKIAGLYFQRQERSPQPEVIQFQKEVGQDRWQPFTDSDGLTTQVLTGLWETMAREARAGRAVSLQGLATLFLVPQLLSSKETSLSALLDRLTAKYEPSVRIQPVGEAKKTTSLKQRVTRRYSEEPELVLISAGQFWMGTERLNPELGGLEWHHRIKDDTPNHQLSLPTYAIGRYPVTNAEYARFIEDGGYRQKAFWTVAGWEKRKQEGWTQPYFWTKDKWNQPNYPVVGVSWYEGVAYCRWLAQITGRPYRLPTEAEWEKAARGPNGHLWPWGNYRDPHRCNGSEKGPGHSTPVGQYSPDGDSDGGVADLVGNVWEWCATKEGKPYPYNIREDEWATEYLEGTDVRVLRGGSFLNLLNVACCTCRFSNYPNVRAENGGVRVMISPI
jgi:TatA/E family protein of Tat protein translocase